MNYPDCPDMPSPVSYLFEGKTTEITLNI